MALLRLLLKLPGTNMSGPAHSFYTEKSFKARWRDLAGTAEETETDGGNEPQRFFEAKCFDFTREMAL